MKKNVREIMKQKHWFELHYPSKSPAVLLALLELSSLILHLTTGGWGRYLEVPGIISFLGISDYQV